MDNHDTILPLKSHDIVPSIAPPRRTSISSTRSTTSTGSKAINRTCKPPTISTQPNIPYSGLGAVDSSASTYSVSSTGSDGRGTPTTPIRRASVRRNAVPQLPPTPTNTTPTNIIPPMIISEAKSHYDLPKRESIAGRSSYDRDVNSELDQTQLIHMNASQGNTPYHSQQQQQLDTYSNSRSSKADDIKRRMSLQSPSSLLKNFGVRNNRNNNACTTLVNNNNNPASPIDHSASCMTLNNNDSAMLTYHSRSNSVHQENLSHHNHNSHHPPQHQSKGIKSQRFGELLAMGGSLLSSRKRGSEANMKNMKKNVTNIPSSTQSINIVPKESSSSWPFKKKDGNTSPNTSKSSLLSRVFNSQNQQNSRPPQQHHRNYSQSVYLAPDSHDCAHRGIGSWTTPAITDDSKIINWELNKSIPSSDYENEAFALWIRPNIQARTVISGVDVENVEKVDFNKEEIMNGVETGFDDELRKKCLPELEDMRILEEVLDFSIVILMRASASLYPFIAGAHSRSIQISIPWRTLQHEEHGFRLVNVRTLKEYQDYIMADIGCAIQAMVEIYDQQERPFSHPDNMGRDVKPQSKSPLIPVILPPNRSRMNKMATSSHSIMSYGSGGMGSMSSRAQSLRPSVASLASPSATSPITPTSTITSSSPPKKHRRHASIPGTRPSISGMISSIKQSLPSPSSLQSPQQSKNSPEAYNYRTYASYPDGTPFLSIFPSRTMPMSYTQAETMERQQSYTYSFNNGTSGSIAGSITGGSSGNSERGTGGKFSQSIQNMLNSFRGNSGSTILSSPSYSYSNSSSSVNSNNSAASPTTNVTLSKQEEKRQQMEHRWRVDIIRRRAHLRSWACRRFLDLYNFSLTTPSSSLEEEFKDLHRIIHAIVDVDANANEKSHDVLATVIAQAREQENEPFKLRYSQYKTKAPTGKEIREANKEAIKRFETDYADFSLNPLSTPSSEVDDSASLKFDECVAPLRSMLRSRECSLDPRASFNYYPPSPTSESCYSSAYDCMEFYGLQSHPVWEPLLDRLTKFDTTHHELDARNIFQFLRRLSLYSPGVNDSRHSLSDEARDEMLAVLWVIEKCVRERPDYQQSPTWFRLSSSASAVQAVCNAGGVIPYLKELRIKDSQGRDPILIVHPVTLTGYFKRLLKESGGLLLKETTGLFVELARPATDNGDCWNLEKLSRIDRALLYRVICLDMNRGQVFLRISRIMDQILKSSPKDMELDAFALSKMVQVVELSGVLDLKALRRWNGAWSAIILGYM
ncbi:hypothetical protein BGZ49_003304 [Haplosporangium sp. Z 27]|nr:hypothetical protein BGZ49_003304 [Haplosporangium sp. Z 27]